MFAPRLFHGAAALLLLALGAAPAEATVIYRETFANNTAVQPSLVTSTGWNTHRGSGGVVPYNVPTDSGPHLTNVVGDLSTGANIAVNSNAQYGEPSGASANFGWAFRNPTADSPKTDYIFWTSEYTVDRSHYALDSITFQTRNTTLTDAMRVAVQIDGSWYASTNTFQTANNTVFGGHTLNFTTATWRPLDFVAGSSLSLGANTPQALPSGNITSFGLYFDQLNDRARFDTFTINATLPSNVTTLAQYVFPESNPSNPPNLAPTTTAANLTVSNLSAGSGITLTPSGTNASPPTSGALILHNLNATTQSGALTAQDYVRFQVTAAPNYLLSIEALTFDFQRDSASQVTSWALYLEDGLTLTLLHSALFDRRAGRSPTNPLYFANSAFNLWQIPELQDVAGTLAFRLYFYGVNSPGGNLARLDNLTLLGNVAMVPEPATGGLMLLAALFVGVPLYRKRRAIAVPARS